MAPAVTWAAAPAAASAPAKATLPTPPGATAAQVTAGAKLYATNTCIGCHGPEGAGSQVGPDFSGKWLWGDGSLASISNIITKGVSAPKKFRSPMPPMGGAQLSATDTSALSAYVWALGHKGK